MFRTVKQNINKFVYTFLNSSGKEIIEKVVILLVFS